MQVLRRHNIPSVIAAGSVPDGKIADYLTGKFVRDTPEEYVRQNIEKALVQQYKYEAKDCAPEFPIKVGSAKKRVDIVVFEADKPHTQETTYILVETKRADIKPSDKKDGVGQLKSYMAACLNARYGLWTNGADRFCFEKTSSDAGEWTFEEIIDIPGFGQTGDQSARITHKDLRPATGDNLLFAFRRCHNYISANEGKQKTEAFWELLKLIFAKIEDERSATLSFYATPEERSSSTIAPAAKKRIQALFDQKVIKKYPTIFDAKDDYIDLRPEVVAYVVTQLQGFSLLSSPVDVKGVAYEEIVGSNLRGDRGEFFTPRNACKMAVRMLDPMPDEVVLDPSCGTGGFLIAAMNNAIKYIEESQRSMWVDPANGTDTERNELYRCRTEYFSHCVFGIDLNPVLVRAAKMNMVMNNDGEGGLFQGNTLENPHRWSPELRKAVKLGGIDVIVSNPPFGAKIPIDDEAILTQYDLAAVWDEKEGGRWEIRRDAQNKPILQKSQPPEILFIERAIQLLKPGSGRMAMVIPNGILNNPSLAYVRQWLLTKVQLLAVVDMHRDLFQPGNDTQTSMVVMRRLTAREEEIAQQSGLDYPIFMAIADKIGHDKRGNTLYRRNDDGSDVLVKKHETIREIDQSTGKEIIKEVDVTDRLVDDELDEVADAFLAWLEEQE